MAGKLAKTISQLEEAFLGMYYGTITPGFVDTIRVPYYGQPTPIKFIAHTSTEGDNVMVRPHDPQAVGEVARTLAGLGLKAYVFSKQAVAVSVPPLSGEGRERVLAQVKKLGEEAKVAVRGVRKQSRQKVDQSLPEDERKQILVEIDDAAKAAEAKISQMVLNKIKTFG